MNAAPLYRLLFSFFLFYSCTKEYSFEGGSFSSGYLVRDMNNDCSQLTVAGNYFAGRNISDSDFLLVQVHVIKAGRYHITSDSINGYFFSASGKFSDTGIVTVKLPATGKPQNAGTNFFNVWYDSSVCQAKVIVNDTAGTIVQTTNPDHFPLAANDRWSYDDLSYPGDSLLWTVNGNSIENGAPHYVIDEYISFFPATNPRYFRRSGLDYFEYVAVSIYTSALDYSPSIYDDLNFLKENIHAGDSWYSNTYTGRTSLGLQVLVLRYLFNCIDGDATVTINGKTFLHVYKIQMIPQVCDVGAVPVATGEIHTAYYAKGVGLIYAESFNGILTHPERQIRSWIVN